MEHWWNDTEYRSTWGWTVERLARLLKMAHTNISLARDIHCCPKLFLFLLPDQRLYIVKNVCVYTRTHTSACLETV